VEIPYVLAGLELPFSYAPVGGIVMLTTGPIVRLVLGLRTEVQNTKTGMASSLIYYSDDTAVT
jgi:hypothetical protein